MHLIEQFWRRWFFKCFQDALKNHNQYPTNGYGFYNRETQVQWGLIKP